MKTLFLIVLCFCAISAMFAANVHVTCSNYYLGGTCTNQCPTSYVKSGQRCQYSPPAPKKQSKDIFAPVTACSPAKIAMFFSWVVYEHNPAKSFNQKFNGNEAAYRRYISGCGEWVIRNEYHYELHNKNSHALVADNAEHGVAVVAFRGTEVDFTKRVGNMLNAWVFGNMKMCKTDFGSGCGEVHSGFYDFYKPLAVDLQAQVKLYLEKGYKIIFTGHSQGAATSTLAAIEAAVKNPKSLNSISLITFASPRVGNQDFVQCVQLILPPSQVTHYVTKYDDDTTDLVPHVPPKTLGYRHIAGATYFVPCDMQFKSNPYPIPGIGLKGPTFAMPKSVICHYPWLYSEGLAKGASAGPALGDDEANALADTFAFDAAMKTEEAEEEEEEEEFQEEDNTAFYALLMAMSQSR